jgi:hypothetical protein
MAVMMYDTGLQVPKLYEHLMAEWTDETLRWSEDKPVLLGVPTYSDAEAYHRAKVENLRTALMGIQKSLNRSGPPKSYQGIAIYCEWETDTEEWEYFETHFLKHSL